MHPLVLLPLATVIIVLGYFVWSYFSTKKSQDPAQNKSGIGGPNDPLA